MEAPELYVGGYFGAGGDSNFSPENRYYEQKAPAAENNNNHFTVDDLLDFPKEDDVMTDAFFDSVGGNSTDSSTVTAVASSNLSVSGNESQFSGNLSCRSFTDAQFSGELCVPYDELAELEWLSNFVEESFSSDDLQNLQLISGSKAPTDNISSSSSETNTTTTHFHPEPARLNNPPIFCTDVSVPGKARSKRSRAAPCDWSSRLLVLSPTTASSSETTTTKPLKTTPSRRREPSETPGRRCLHCASEKTPQWRTGPMGPKTLCNACGVRYKSGRLVPEYRPAASPTFVSAKHSNSHRKVVELRRQKEVQRSHHHHHHQTTQFISQNSIFGVTNGGDDYLIHHHQGPTNFSHFI